MPLRIRVTVCNINGIGIYVSFRGIGIAWITTGLTDMTEDEKLRLMHAFAEAWNAHDIVAIMSCMTDDCVFEASAGPDVCGARSVGREEVRAAFSEVFAAFPDAQWRDARHFSSGDRGVSEWTLTGTRNDGTKIEVNGCDLLTFRDGKIAVKNSYRKNRP